MLRHRDERRNRHTCDVTCALTEYLLKGGSYRFESERDQRLPLAIRFELEDQELFDQLLTRRMKRSSAAAAEQMFLS